MTTPTKEAEPTTTDAVLTALAHERRRAVLRTLQRTDGQAMGVDALVEHVAEPTADHRRRVRTTLHHVHLPKLRASRLIEIDDEADRVRLVDSDLGDGILSLVEAYDRGTSARSDAPATR